MLVQVKQQIRVNRKIYKLGVQDIPDHELEHPHFKFYKKAGVVAPPPKGEQKTLPKPTSDVAKGAQAASKNAAAQVDEGPAPMSQIGEADEERIPKETKVKKGR